MKPPDKIEKTPNRCHRKCTDKMNRLKRAWALPGNHWVDYCPHCFTVQGARGDIDKLIAILDWLMMNPGE